MDIAPRKRSQVVFLNTFGYSLDLLGQRGHWSGSLHYVEHFFFLFDIRQQNFHFFRIHNVFFMT